MAQKTPVSFRLGSSRKRKRPEPALGFGRPTVTCHSVRPAVSHSHIRPRICTDAPDDGTAEGKEASSPSTTSSAAEENSLDADPDSFRAAVDLKQQGNVLAEQSR